MTSMRISRTGLLCLVGTLFSFTAYANSDDDASSLSFSVRWNSASANHAVAAAFVLPDELLKIEAVAPAKEEASFALNSGDGKIEQSEEIRWAWRAPKQPGNYEIRIQRKDTSEEMRLVAIVMHPFSSIKKEKLNKFRMGRYPQGKRATKTPPRGFIEVTKENEDTLLSPHFRLKQFLCKQGSKYPKYIALSELLPLKLEAILDRLKERGVELETLHIMSGFRTPHYNRSLGNVKLSRHQWGEAADILVDDLNGDGKTTTADAGILYGIIDEMSRAASNVLPVGGLAKYNRTHSHGPFVHVDVRGYFARW